MCEVKTPPRLTAAKLRAMATGDELWLNDCWPKEAQNIRSIAYNNSTSERRYIVNYFGQDKALRITCQKGEDSPETLKKNKS